MRRVIKLSNAVLCANGLLVNETASYNDKDIAIKLNQFTYMRIMNRDYLIKISLTYSVFIIVAPLNITSLKRS